VTVDLQGKSIREFRSKSFYMDGSLVSEHLILFFDVEGVWYSITIVDGIVHLKKETLEPYLTKHHDMDFSYPISNVDLLSKYIGLKVESVYTYNLVDINEGVLGLYISFGSLGFSYYNVDDFSYVEDGRVQIPLKQPTLVECKFFLP
jgi:hypothetical protein